MVTPSGGDRSDRWVSGVTFRVLGSDERKSRGAGSEIEVNPIEEAYTGSTDSLVFAQYLRELASWRREKAEEYPDDPRHSRSAKALDELADHFEESQEVKPWMHDALEQGANPPGERLKREASRHGYDFPVKSAESRTTALESMAVDAVIDAYDNVTPEGDATGLLHPWEEQAARDGLELERRYFERRMSMTAGEQEEWIDSERSEGDDAR